MSFGPPDMSPMFVIHNTEQDLYGCPHCSDDIGHYSAHTGNAMIWNCVCNKTYVVIHDSLERSPIGFGNREGTEYPAWTPHPKALEYKK